MKELCKTLAGVAFMYEGTRAFILAQDPAQVAWVAVCVVLTGLILAQILD